MNYRVVLYSPMDVKSQRLKVFFPSTIKETKTLCPQKTVTVLEILVTAR
jgi:hypothetical protein